MSEGEAEFEILRKNIEKSDIHLEALFRLITRENKISRQEFATFLKSNKILAKNKDINALLKRMDKKNTMFISLQDFLGELTPTQI